MGKIIHELLLFISILILYVIYYYLIMVLIRNNYVFAAVEAVRQCIAAQKELESVTYA
jgi:hypothetical protein